MATAILLIAAVAEAIGVPAPPLPADVTVPPHGPSVHSADSSLIPVSETRSTGRVLRGHSLRGKASWHATGRDGLFAAACRPLRRAMGKGWRGTQVIVVWRRRMVAVRLNDWCRSRDKTIDLSDEAFGYLSRGHLSRGVLYGVTVEWPR